MLPIFWSPTDPCIRNFIVSNKSHIQVSHQFPFYFVCSGGIDTDIINLYGSKSLILISQKNRMRTKGKILFDAIRNLDFDVLIRVDMDAIIFDLQWLLKEAEIATKFKCVAGKIKRGNLVSGNKEKYVRGGCHVVSKEIAHNIYMTDEPGTFDSAFSVYAKKAGASLLDTNTFEESISYSKNSPVWHPKKKKNRFYNFLKHIKLLDNI